MARWQDDTGARRLKEGRGLTAAAVSVGMLVFFLTALLLNGQALHRNADNMPYGNVRRISLALTAPLDAISRTTGLGRIREWLEKRFNKETVQ